MCTLFVCDFIFALSFLSSLFDPTAVITDSVDQLFFPKSEASAVGPSGAQLLIKMVEVPLKLHL